MAEESKNPAGTTEKCTKCGNVVPSDSGKQTSKGFVCNDCLKKTRRSWLIAILVLLLLAIIVILVLCCTAKKSDNVCEADESALVEETPAEVFNIATATVITLPATTHPPVVNAEEFKHAVELAIGKAQASGENKIEIPAIAIKFDFNSDFLTKESKDLLDEVAKLYNETNKEGRFTVNGYTCNAGTDESNNLVSLKRANAVKAALVKHVIEESKIKAYGYGKSRNSEFKLPHDADYRRVLIIIE